MTFTLPELGYSFDALEPHIDARTMEIHHDKHHAGYVAKLNAAVEGTEYADKTLGELISSIEALPENMRGAVRNNGGGHWNHTLFWKVMAPGNTEGPSGEFADSINNAFGSLDGLKEAFANSAATRFGSGHDWIIYGESSYRALVFICWTLFDWNGRSFPMDSFPRDCCGCIAD